VDSNLFNARQPRLATAIQQRQERTRIELRAALIGTSRPALQLTPALAGAGRDWNTGLLLTSGVWPR
jgi:hypothetical protein